MKKKLNETEKRFIEFLDAVNIADQGDRSRVTLPGMIRSEPASDLDEQNSQLRKALSAAIVMTAGSKIEGLSNYISGGLVIEDILPDPWDERERIVQIVSNFERFRREYRAFKQIWILGHTVDQHWVKIYRDANGLIQHEMRDLFFGFRDFNLVRSCAQCGNFFLATRDDKKYCTEECGYTARNERLKKPEEREAHLSKRKDAYQENKDDVSKQQKAYRKRKNGGKR